MMVCRADAQGRGREGRVPVGVERNGLHDGRPLLERDGAGRRAA